MGALNGVNNSTTSGVILLHILLHHHALGVNYCVNYCGKIRLHIQQQQKQNTNLTAGVSKLFAKKARFGEVKMCGGCPFSMRFFEPLLMNAFNVNDKY